MSSSLIPASLGPRRLYLDLDGVMADFSAQYLNLFGADKEDELESDAVWPRIDTVRTSFFATMPMCPGAADFFAAIRHLNPIILTACPKSDYANVAGQKRAWVQSNLSPDLTILPTAGGGTKPLFMHRPGDVLIDDFERNCRAWERHGGRPILHRSFRETCEQLRLLTIPNPNTTAPDWAWAEWVQQQGIGE